MTRFFTPALLLTLGLVACSEKDEDSGDFDSEVTEGDTTGGDSDGGEGGGVDGSTADDGDADDGADEDGDDGGSDDGGDDEGDEDGGDDDGADDGEETVWPGSLVGELTYTTQTIDSETGEVTGELLCDQSVSLTSSPFVGDCPDCEFAFTVSGEVTEDRSSDDCEPMPMLSFVWLKSV